MALVLAAIFAAAMSALNIVLYVMTGSPWSLGGAIFCGFLAYINLVAA